jgi:2-dehydropantoate 2-reductase
MANTHLNFIVLGAGTIGCYVGARLLAAGQQVTLVGRPRMLEPLALGGITVTDLEGFTTQVQAKDLPLALNLATAWASRRLDATTVILLCVKGGATVSAALEIAACCPPGTPVISLQNGVENVARLQSAAPSLQALPGMVPYNVVMRSATHVHRATMGSIYLPQNALTAQIAPLFNAAGLACVLAEDMRAVQWGKLLLNLNNPVNALSDLPLRTQLLDRDFRHVLAALQSEALIVLGAAGIVPAKVASAPPRALPHLLRLPNWLFTRIAARMLRIDASARSSMWDDLQQGRITEVDDLCGAVVRLATQHGTSAPCNATMCQLIAAHTSGQRWTGAALLKEFHI